MLRRLAPVEVAPPPQSVSSFNYLDSDDDLEPQDDHDIIRDFQRGEERMRYHFDVAADRNPEYIPEWARNPIHYNFEAINRIWCLSQRQDRW